MTHEAFVLKLDGKYAKFGSYSSVRLVDNPLKASLYTFRHQAVARTTDEAWVDGDREPTGGGEFSIVKITVRVEDEEDVS